MTTERAPTQLSLTPPVPLREAMARACARILDDAKREAETLRARGHERRALELLHDREILCETMKRASSYAEPRGRRKR